MNTRTGRFIVVDIGSEETKLMDVTVGTKITIHAIERMRDMTPFVQEGQLCNFEQFVLSLIDTLTEWGMKSKRLLLVSSILGIKSELVSMPKGSRKVLDSTFKANMSEYKPELYRFDYQPYAVYTTEQDSSVYCVQAVASTYTLSSLLKLLADNSYSVIDVIDPMSARLNLTKLYPSNYDTQYRLLMYIGHQTMLYPIVRDAPMEEKPLGVSFHDVISAMVMSFEMNELKARKIFSVVGVKRTSAAESQLFEFGVDVEQYFNIVNDSMEEFTNRLMNIIKSYAVNNKFKISAAMVFGGYADVPGIIDELSEITGFAIDYIPDSMMTYTNIQIINKTNEDLGSTYMTCIGAVLGNKFRNRISLKPRGITKKTSLSTVSKVCTAATVGAVVFLSLSGISLFRNWSELDRLENVQLEVSRMSSRLNTVTADIDAQKAYLAALNNVDTLLQPITNYVAAKETATFCVASIDTENVLITPEVNTGTVEFLEGEQAQTDDPDSSFIQAEDADSSLKSPIYIRGYALTMEEIQQFYDGMGDMNFVHDISLTGQRLVELPSGEEMYIFEIKVER